MATASRNGRSVLVALLWCGPVAMLLPMRTASAQQRWYVEQYTANNGLPQNSVRSLAFDARGYLWLTTEAGLVRFDGRNFQVHTTATDTCVLEDRMGHLFPTTEGDLLVMDALGSAYRIKEHGLVRLFDGRAFPDRPRHITGAVPSTRSLRTLVLQALPDTVRWRWQDWQDQILPQDTARWAMLGPLGLSFHHGARLVKMIPVVAERYMAFLLDGRIHVLDTAGVLHRYDPVTDRLLPIRMRGPRSSTIERFVWDPIRSSVYALTGDTLWKAGYAGEDLVLRPLVTDLPAGTAILSVTATEDGDNIFVGTESKGLFRYSVMPFTTTVNVRKGDDQVRNSFYAMVPVDSSSVLTPQGWVADKKGFTEGPVPMASREPTAMHRDQHGRIWTSRNDTIWIADHRTANVLRRSNSPTGTVTAYWQEGDTTWVAGIAGVVGYVDTVAAIVYPRKARFIHKQITALQRGPDGRLWIATGQGVFAMGADTREGIPIAGLQEVFARSLFRRGELLFVGTYGQGAFAWANGRVVPFPHDPSHALSHVHAFVPGGDGRLWMPTNNGLYSVEMTAVERYIRDTTAVFQYAFHGLRSGIGTLEFNGGCSPPYASLDDGHLVLPTIDGLVWFKPLEVRDPWSRGSVRVDAVRVNGVPMDPHQAMAPVGTDAVIDVFTSIPFWGDPRNLQLRYRFAGSKEPTLPVPADGHIEVVRLPAGAYTLQVLLPGADGTIQDLLTFTVDPPWYMRWWAIVGQALLLVLIGWLINRWRYHRVLGRKNELERIVHERTDQLQHRNESLRQESEVKERLVRILSHDIVAPLKAIARVGRQGTDGTGGWSDHEVRSAFRDMSMASFQLHDSATNLLDWIKHQGGRIEVRRLHVALHGFVASVVDRSRASADQHHVVLENAVADEMLVVTDPDLLGIILHNVISNAVKYAPGSRVRISADELPDGFRLVIADSGPGMSAASLDRINALLAGHGRSTELRSGLGYMIIADMAGLMGGVVTVSSGPGTCITLELRAKAVVADRGEQLGTTVS